MGGNGILHDRYIMKGLCDIEALYTLEGTYEINTLIAGREITGMAAFKPQKNAYSSDLWGDLWMYGLFMRFLGVFEES